MNFSAVWNRIAAQASPCSGGLSGVENSLAGLLKAGPHPPSKDNFPIPDSITPAALNPTPPPWPNPNSLRRTQDFGPIIFFYPLLYFSPFPSPPLHFKQFFKISPLPPAALAQLLLPWREGHHSPHAGFSTSKLHDILSPPLPPKMRDRVLVPVHTPACQAL